MDHLSVLPGLLGLNSLRKNRAVLDFNTLTLYMCGPGPYDPGACDPVPNAPLVIMILVFVTLVLMILGLVTLALATQVL